MSEPAFLPAAAPREISSADLELPIDLGVAFRTTAELSLEGADGASPLGQERAVRALELGMGIRGPGYNVFVIGLTGADKLDRVRDMVSARVREARTPDDWVYLNNFKDPETPWAVRLPAGEGRALSQEMDNLIERLREYMPKAFKQEGFEKEKEELQGRYAKEVEELTRGINEKAQARGFRIARGPGGNFLFIPTKASGEPLAPKEIEALSAEEQRKLAEEQRSLAHDLKDFLQRQQGIMDRLAEEIAQVERGFAATLVGPLVKAIAEKHPAPRIGEYLRAVQDHILANLSAFKEGEEEGGMPFPFMPSHAAKTPFIEYKVNALVDNSETRGAPVVVETAPNYRNLFGAIEKLVDPMGRIVTDFTRIRAGSMIRASGGYLIFSIEDALQELQVYKFLKRALRNRRIEIESYDPFAMFSTTALQPEPIDLDTKVIVVGSPLVYQLLLAFDDEFSDIFKAPAEIAPDLPREAATHASYALAAARAVRDEGLPPFTRDAVEEMVRWSARRADDRERLSADLSALADLMREAAYFAEQEGKKEVEGELVRRAVDERVFRAGRVEERLRDMVRTGVLKVDVSGAKVGQVNALAVYAMGDYAFGKPSRVTASVSMGAAGIVNIEREAKLSGSTHDKGVLILSGYLRGRYAQERPIALSASIAFEQSYGGIEGDSASSTELYALLSRIAGLPVRQDLAVTGSVNQWGEVQAIGGVNEKVEGFYRTCKAVGLTGAQGVLIPASNARHLVLAPEVRRAVADGRFHLYPVETIDEGIALLTGVKAGGLDEPGTVNHAVAKRLAEMAEKMRRFGEPLAEPKKPAED